MKVQKPVKLKKPSGSGCVADLQLGPCLFSSPLIHWIH